jgi:hypothetical protein
MTGDLEAGGVRRPAPDGPCGDSVEARTRHLLAQLDAPPPARRFEVSLVRQGTSVPAAEWVADEQGVFGFHADPGRYDLFVRHGDSILVLPNIEIR